MEEKQRRIQEFQNAGFAVTDLEPTLPALNGCTAGPILERAALLSHALTNRKFGILMAARGGYGVTELIPFLEYMLPPVLPSKTLVGFSDISYLGVYLSLKFPNVRYIHARNAFSDSLFLDDNPEKEVLFNLLNHKAQKNEFPCFSVTHHNEKIAGVCIPLNLSLAESLIATKNISLPQNTILFLEDCHEYVYRLLRKFDSLILSGFLENVKAIVLGDFTKPLTQDNQEMPREEFLKIVAAKLNKPTFDWPLFGHGNDCFPLVAHSHVILENNRIAFTYECPLREWHMQTETTFGFDLIHFIHMCGIGGTGMASVAGLLKSGGYEVSGSDNVVYPPMDKVLIDLQIKPDVGYKKENIINRKIDMIVMGNVMSRKTAALQKNEELEEILQQNIPVMSFPSALRKIFLNKSFNIVVTGTHGKTTTSSLFAYLLKGLGGNPSFLIGGMPANFGQGFGLNSKDLFVLEGDEYDSAFFDKGPKFLHYEPSITLINNIEFDHADIYENIEAIENEFKRLAELTLKRKGFIIVNWDDQRVKKIAIDIKENVIAFGSAQNTQCDFPLWSLNSFDTTTTGITIHFTAPDKTIHSISCTQIFGKHNALNVLAVLAGLHAKYLLNQQNLQEMLKDIKKIDEVLKNFKGIKRRFELLGHKKEITVFDDFAHHPTAVRTTLQAFRDYISLTKKEGRLIVCFDPHNATMRRNILQEELAKSFAPADMLFLGKIPEDLRMNQEHVLNGNRVIESCGIKAQYFDENQKLLDSLQKEAKASDTIVFMSSGSFDGIPQRFVNALEKD